MMKQVPFQDVNSPSNSPSQTQDQYDFVFITVGLLAFILLMLTLPFYSTQNQDNNIPIIQIGQQWKMDNIYAGELQYPRIPQEYWEHRIKMVKSMGLNTLSLYIFWNFHQIERGVFDFQTQNKNLTRFLQLAQKNQMKVLIRPGPYVCAQWDLGGLPARLLSIEGIQLRANNQLFLDQVKLYFQAVASVIKPFLVSTDQKQATIILLQIQNQYGFIGNDKGYINKLRQIWVDLDINCEFYYVDWIQNIQKSYWEGATIGINNGFNSHSYQYARILNKNGKLFGGQIYSGWFSLWGNKLQGKSIQRFMAEYQSLVANNHSFAMYMVHGGTSFGLSAGANNILSLNNQPYYCPIATTYDYDAPINEQGSPNKKYFQFKKLLSSYVNYQIPAAPQLIPLMSISQFYPQQIGQIFDSDQFSTPSINGSQNLFLFQSKQLQMFHQGIVIYQTILQGQKQYFFQIEVSDLAIVYLDFTIIKVLNRTQRPSHTFKFYCAQQECKMIILVQAMGHINFGQKIQNDLKGITKFNSILDKVTHLKQAQTNQKHLKQSLNTKDNLIWNMYKIQLQKEPEWKNKGKCQKYPCLFRAQIQLQTIADTYLNLSKFQKGYVWINGYNLGRFWNIGPTFNLFCPGAWLRVGKNRITILDMLGKKGQAIWGQKQSELIYEY